MTEPEDAADLTTLNENHSSFSSHSKWLCALITIGLAPFSFIGCIVLLSDGEINTAGMPIYGFLVFVFAIPIGILNSFIIAPAIAARYTPQTRLWVPATVHFCGFIACIFGLWLCLHLMPAFIGSLGQFGFIVLVIWYLAVFFCVPVFAGSIAYSYCHVLHLTSRLSSHQQQPQCGVSDSRWPDH